MDAGEGLRGTLKRRLLSGQCQTILGAFLSQAPWSPSVPGLTPVCGFIPGNALVVDMSELSKTSRHAEDLWDPGKAQGVVEV